MGRDCGSAGMTHFSQGNAGLASLLESFMKIVSIEKGEIRSQGSSPSSFRREIEFELFQNKEVYAVMKKTWIAMALASLLGLSSAGMSQTALRPPQIPQSLPSTPLGVERAVPVAQE